MVVIYFLLILYLQVSRIMYWKYKGSDTHETNTSLSLIPTSAQVLWREVESLSNLLCNERAGTEGGSTKIRKCI